MAPIAASRPSAVLPSYCLRACFTSWRSLSIAALSVKRLRPVDGLCGVAGLGTLGVPVRRGNFLVTGPGRPTLGVPAGYRLTTLRSSAPPASGPSSLPLLSSLRISSMVIHLASEVSARAWWVERSGVSWLGTVAAMVVYFHSPFFGPTTP